MKKIIIACILMVSFSGAAFAAGTDLASNAVSTAGYQIFGGVDSTAAAAATSPLAKLSTGVSLVANYDNTGYAIFTKHLKGTKVYGTAYDSTAISWKVATDPKAVISTTDTGSVTVVPSGWTSM